MTDDTRPSRHARGDAAAPEPWGLSARAVLRLPAFWAVLAVLTAGGVRMAMIAKQYVDTYPVATVAAVVTFTLFAVPFWLFIAELDYLEREPPILLAAALAWGGLVATAVSIPGSTALQNLMAKLGSPHLAAAWGATLAGPTIEEITKTLGVVAVVLVARAQVNSVLDGVVYGALVGLGFQVVENIIFALGAVAADGRGDRIGPVITTLLVRGILAGLWSHTLFGALAGAGIGYLVAHTDRPMSRRLAVAGLAVFGAWSCHCLWNSPWPSDSLGDGALAVLVVLVGKGLVPLLVVLLMVRRVCAREVAFYVGQLAAVTDPELVTADERAALGYGGRRAAARSYAHARVGWRGRRGVRRLHRAQAGLAVALSRHGADAPAVAWRAQQVRRERSRLVHLGHPEAVAPDDRPGPWRRTASTVGTMALAAAVLWALINTLTH